jgi:hypothetical protein
MENKPYLLSLASDCIGNKKYIDTLPNVLDSVEPIMVQFMPHYKAAAPILDNNFFSARIYFEQKPYPGHLRRWDSTPLDLDKDRYVIFTDTSDVIFQAPIPAIDKRLIYVANEGIRFGENGFWMGVINEHPKFKFLESQEVFNVGCFGAPVRIFEDWIHFIQENREGIINQAVEQLLFNQWLRLPEIRSKVVTDPKLFVTLYDNIDKQNVFQMDGVGFVGKEGDLFSIVHANGNMKYLLKDYEK